MGKPVSGRARTPRAVRVTGLAALVAAALSGCSAEQAVRFGWPDGITDRSQNVLDLWTGSAWAALIVGAAVWGLMFWTMYFHRKRSDELPRQVAYNLPIEVLYTVLPFLIIAVLFYYTALSEVYVNKLSRNPDVRVGIVAFKWNWRFNYLDEQVGNGDFLATQGSTEEVPILVLPTGRSIRFVQSSEDVIHSFWVPEFLFKRDVIPDRVNTWEATILADKEGAYVGRCAELCGTYHANMNFEVRAVSPDAYERFLVAKREGLSTALALEAIGQPGTATTTSPFLVSEEQQARG